VDQYTGSLLGVCRSVGNPLKNHHEHQVAKETQHEEQLWDQHKEHAAELTKVPEEKNNNNKDK